MPITKGFRTLVDEATAQITTYTVAQVLARLAGASLRIQFFQQTDPDEDPVDRPEYSERLFSIDLHAEADLEVVPAGWPGGMVLLPAQPR